MQPHPPNRDRWAFNFGDCLFEKFLLFEEVDLFKEAIQVNYKPMRDSVNLFVMLRHDNMRTICSIIQHFQFAA